MDFGVRLQKKEPKKFISGSFWIRGVRGYSTGSSGAGGAGGSVAFSAAAAICF